MSAKEIGFIGLGRMGKNMVSRMLGSKKITVHAWDRSDEVIEELEQKGAIGATSVENLVEQLQGRPKVLWMMLPAGEATEVTFQTLLGLLEKGDIIIDGANSNWQESVRRHKAASLKGINTLDVGVSGGIVAADTGYPMMIGGKEEIYKHCLPIFESFGIPGGFDLVGDHGSGHYVKMIHNAIEYGMMQAMSEGFDLLKNGSKKDLDLKKISRIWNEGTVISSFLMKMIMQAIEKNEKLDNISPWVDDSGEGKWSVLDAVANDVPFVANTYALNARFQSRDKDSYALKLLAAMRNEFGGHQIKESSRK
uniref:6-phosphogluconate dehydrogenase n=1 Tax=Candidatus Kentrum sp. FW TaxID=2126338 RepID=A0A450TKN8_9GAMM|nr:MAG: 6-phosphogluconate dehydrogenase [Candidatus Kentron sp. FW]VFJ68199.1 MAG: 6-phosphogluconate dehydrogenase [Candidatus Kentron sp. FW]